MKHLHILIIFVFCLPVVSAAGKLQVVRDGADGGKDSAVVVEPVIELSPQITLPSIQTEVKTKLFEMRFQKAVIAWNGKTETLLLTSEGVSITGKEETVVGIIPLPGKPLDLRYEAQDTLDKVDSFLNRKLPDKGQAVAITGSVETMPQLPVTDSYSVFVLQIDRFEDFAELLNNKVKNVLKQHVKVVLSDEDKNVLKRYFERGFRHFIFDVSPLFLEYRQKHPLLVQFESNDVYYPLAVCAINGTGRSVTELTVITPGEIRLSDAFEKELKDTNTKLTIVGNQSIDWTFDELTGIDTMLFKQFDGVESVKARKLIFPLENVNKFGLDFQAK